MVSSGKHRKVLRDLGMQHNNTRHLKSTAHKGIFADIQKLGKTRLENYQATIFVESRTKPWKSLINSRAYLISELAHRCLQDRQNELTWRLRLETLVLTQFGLEVNWYVRTWLAVSY
jgi:hypothetical protein